VTTIPAHAALLRGQPSALGLARGGQRAGSRAAAAPAREPVDADARTALRTLTFWLLALACVIQSFVHAGFTLHAVVLLVERGHDATFAATAAGLIGAMQVGGRLVFAPLRTRLSQRAVTMLIFGLQGVALLALRAVPGVPGVLAFVVCFGIGNGMTTLMRASIVADLYGRTHYGSIAGVLALCSTGARAVAPVTVGLLYEAWRGYSPILVLLAALSCVAVAAAGLALRPPDRVVSRPTS
jgi:cyanate permease